MTALQALPVNALVDDLLAQLPGARVVIEAPPGAGKSTALPLALLASDALQQQRIIMLQPRRIAAVSIARFLAEQLMQPVGNTVGYHIRGDACFTAETKLLIVTEGMFTQYLQRDPELQGVGLVIFDEFHERALASDLGLAMLQESLSLRDDLSLLVMSATLPAQVIADWLGDASVLSSAGRQFPITTHYRPAKAGAPWLQQVAPVIKEAMGVAQQGILVFLPGQREIQYVARQLGDISGWEVSEMHRQVPLSEQQRILSGQTRQGEKRIVLATNIAETSLTIPNIDVVVDSGRERQAIFYPQHGVTRLVTRKISRASATQRAGRSGRLGPGECFRLWASADDHGMREYQVPELETADLSGLLLECKRWGSEPEQLRFLTPPAPAHLQAAEQLLQSLQATTEQGRLTNTGQQLAEYATAPRLARILTAAQTMDEHSRSTAAWLVAQLEYQPQAQTFPLAVQALPKPVKRRYQHWCKQLKVSTNTTPNAHMADLLLWGFADRLALRRGDSDRYLLAYGGGAVMHREDSRPRPTWQLVLDVTLSEAQTDAIIGPAIGLTESDLDHAAVNISEHEDVRWVGPQQRLQAVISRQIGAIELAVQIKKGALDSEARSEAFARYVQEHGLRMFSWRGKAEQWLARAQLFAQYAAEWPGFDEATLLQELSHWATPYWQSIETIQQLKSWQPLAALQARLSYEQLQQLNEHCPERFSTPSGRSHSIDYSQSPPVLAVKLQELFGEPVSPTVCFGRVTITLDLLSPAGRLLQRTSDLASFWANAYTHVKKEMKGRYPKHPWPDDPQAAQATHKTKRHLQ